MWRILRWAWRGWLLQVRAIGVSNFGPKRLAQFLATEPRIAPVVNQVEMHPYLPQTELLEYCMSKKVVVTAYCPLGSPGNAATWVKRDHPALISHPDVRSIATRRGKPTSQVILRWGLQRGVVVIPKSTNV